MAKYNVGDVLEITEDFELEAAQFSEGEKYAVVELDESFYSLESEEYFINTISLVDAHSGFSKVEPKVDFKVGDKVRLLEDAHSSPGYSTDNSEKVKSRLSTWGLDYQTEFTVTKVKDWEGDVYVSNGDIGLYILSEFLVPWVEEEEKPAEHMELGKTYQSMSNDFFYTPTAFVFESERVAFDFRSDVDSFVSTSHRYFYSIEEEFGVLPPVKPVGVSQVALDEVKTENTLAVDVARVEGDPWLAPAPKPETVSVDALREAWDYVDHEYPDIEKLIKLAKRLS